MNLPKLVALRDNAYVSYIQACEVTECLGEEAKIKCGEFGIPELEVHRKAWEWLGKYRAYAHAIEILNTEEPQ